MVSDLQAGAIMAYIHTVYTYQISTLHVSTEIWGPGWLNELGILNTALCDKVCQ